MKAFLNLAQMTLSRMSETETTGSPEQKQEWLAEQMLRWSGLVRFGNDPRIAHPSKQSRHHRTGDKSSVNLDRP